MRYRNTIIAFGFAILVFSTPLIGIPQSWKVAVVQLSALAVAFLAYLAGKEPKTPSSGITS
jgi:hypothetical protein